MMCGFLPRRILASAVAGLVLVNASCVCAGELLLRWTTSSTADGYRLYMGPQSRQYTGRQDLGLLSADTVGPLVYFLVSGLEAGSRYFFAVTAYDVAGESDYSNEKIFDLASITPPRADAGADQTGAVGQILTLGSAPDFGISYIWEQTSGPPALSFLSNRTSSTTQFTSTAAGTYQFNLIAYDSLGLASQALVNVVISSSTPTPTPTPTSVRTVSLTTTPSLTPTPIFITTTTPTPVWTFTPTTTRTATATASPAFTATTVPLGFCEGRSASGTTVTVADLIVGVNIALALLPLEACPAFDFDGNLVVTVDELLRAANLALNGRP